MTAVVMTYNKIVIQTLSVYCGILSITQKLIYIAHLQAVDYIGWVGTGWL